MARQISRAEAWERAHDIFTQVNFSAFDFNTIKESLLDYVKLYFPEDFNDYIESSEFIAVLELFAYVGELLSYRIDMNAHENFITTAQRKESILRLAKLISYKSSRNIPARGLVKINSIQTTESMTDSSGNQLAGKRIYWNDSNNASWKEQFLLVINRILEQDFGSVAPDERVQVDDVLFELYTMNNNQTRNDSKSVIPYTTVVEGQTYPMELVPVSLTSSGPQEKRPEIRQKFTILYGNDGIGDSSDTTGFMMFTKQGRLTFETHTFDGITPNQTIEINVDNINETDIWMNNVDPDTLQVLTEDPYADVFPHLVANDLRYGDWIEVDQANGQNIMFNTNPNRHKFEVETLDDDHVRFIFGDGEFSDIPSGTFHIWYRTSANRNFYIERNSVVNQQATFSYLDLTGATQTITVTFSLISSLQNASASEDIEHIRRVAPSVYYTQDRMVNGRDYNTFMLQDPSILRMRAINRTFAGDSKYITWHDPKESYEDVKIFGDDLAIYWAEEDPQVTAPVSSGLVRVTTSVEPEDLFEQYVEPLLSNTDLFSKLGPLLQEVGKEPEDMRRYFFEAPETYSFGPGNERDTIIQELTTAMSSGTEVKLYYQVDNDEWLVTETHPCQAVLNSTCSSPIEMFIIQPQFFNSSLSGWEIRWRTRRMIAHSANTKFWNSHTTDRVINYDTLNSTSDVLVVLRANTNPELSGLLDSDISFNILAQEFMGITTPESGLPDVNRLSILPEDKNGDGIPDDLIQSDLFDAVFELEWPTDESNPRVGEVPTITSIVDSGTGSTINLGSTWIDLSKLGGGQSFVASQYKGYDFDVEIFVDTGSGYVRQSYGNDPRFEYQTITGWLDGFAAAVGAAESDPQSDFYRLSSSLIQDKLKLRQGVMNEIQTAVGNSTTVKVKFVFKGYTYLHRDDEFSSWYPIPATSSNRIAYAVENLSAPDTPLLDNNGTQIIYPQFRYIRHPGRYPMNFAWMHSTDRLNLVDPAASNIIDIYVTTVGYYTGTLRWLYGQTELQPVQPTPLELRTAYQTLLDNKMISDTVLMHSGQFKILFGPKAKPQLQCVFKVIRPATTTLTDNQVKVRIVEIVRAFFNIEDWEYGETFFFTELSAAIHAELGPEIDTFVIVPLFASNQFGDMFQVSSREDELFLPDINTTDIEIVESLTPSNLRQLTT